MTREEARWTISIMASLQDSNSPLTEALELTIEALQERPKGRWITVREHGFECSCCGRYIATEVREDKASEAMPYCFCGADMRGEEE